jgi:hypothetical protein
VKASYPRVQSEDLRNLMEQASDIAETLGDLQTAMGLRFLLDAPGVGTKENKVSDDWLLRWGIIFQEKKL